MTALRHDGRGFVALATESPSAWNNIVRRLRPRVRRRIDAELRYRTLFDRVSDGFALVQMIRDANGRVSDYVVLEANPALLKILKVDFSLVGRRQSELFRTTPPGWLEACETAMGGQPITFEYQAEKAGRWLEIHLSRIDGERLAQLVVDITDRKRVEHRQLEMFAELNHRVKNNLAIVSAMLSIQARSAKSEDVRGPLEMAVERIQTVADVHTSLYRTGRKDDVDFAAYLQDLCERLRRSVLDGDRMTLELQTDPASLPLDKAVALGVLVNELVTNAAKHAYPPPGRGPIKVRLKTSESALVLTVADSGAGLPDEPPGPGLGMRFVRSLVQQLGATMETESQSGATFHVQLPYTPRPRR